MADNPDGYFTKIGIAVSRALARDVLAKHTAGSMARDSITGRHPMLARDQDMPSPAGMTYNQDQEGGTPSAEEIIAALRTCWVNCSPEEKNELIQAFTDLAGEGAGNDDGELMIRHMPNEGNGNGGGRANMPPYSNGDRGRGARDGVVPARQQGQDRKAMDQAFAARARRSQNFAERFPFVNVQLTGSGSRP